MHWRALHFAFLLLLAPLPAPTPAGQAAQEATPDVERFTARDAHQGVTIAVRTVSDVAEAESLFGKDAAPVRAGLLAVEMHVENRRAGAITINLSRIKILRDGDQWVPVTPGEAALRLYPLPEGRVPDLGPRRLPIPGGPKMPKDKKRSEREETEASLASRQFRARNIPPGGQARGFLYFDLGAVGTDLTGAQLYVPEVDDTSTDEGLLFFEIALAPREKP